MKKKMCRTGEPDVDSRTDAHTHTHAHAHTHEPTCIRWYLINGLLTNVPWEG